MSSVWDPRYLHSTTPRPFKDYRKARQVRNPRYFSLVVFRVRFEVVELWSNSLALWKWFLSATILVVQEVGPLTHMVSTHLFTLLVF
jgi:hypothetical protein